MTGKWINNVKPVQPGEQVKAGVVNRPTRALESRTATLKERLDAAELGHAIFDTDAVVAPNVLEGQPVYFDSTTQRYELALAAAETDSATGTIVTSPSSDCLGILYEKKTSNSGDVLLVGVVKLPALLNAIDNTIEPGRYYLSSAEPGKLVRQRPAVTVGVCFVQGPKDTCDDDPWVLVNPQVRDFLEDHIHYRFALVCRPAGSHSADDAVSSGRHVITDADATEEGWLPADHESFAGKAPTGAVFGYNLAKHVQLQRVWPPVPLQAVSLLWDKGAELVGATEIPLGADGLAICDANGIWWMSDCYGDAPWPATFDNVAAVSSSSAAELSSEAETPECPRTELMRLNVVFLRMTFGNDRSVVTSLQPGAGSPITVTNCDGDPARTGDLKLGLALSFLIDPELASGALVFKELIESFKFKRGYVAEGLIAGDTSISLSGTVTRPLSSADGAPTVHQGIITVTANLEPTDRELPPQIVRLADAVERLYKDVPYIGFPEAQDASVRLRINVPPAGLPTTPQLKIRALIFGRVAATLPPLTMTYRRLPLPAAGTPVSLPTADASLTFDVEVDIDVDQMVTVESAAFTVAAGDTVLVTIARAADSGYNGEVGIIRWGGILLSG